MHTRLATVHLGTPNDDMNENGKDDDNGLETHFFSSFFIYFTNDYLQINMVGLFSPTASHHLSTTNYATSATVSYKTINEQEKKHTYGPRDIASLSLGPSFCVLP